jgi:hypothetical protein
LLFQILNLSIDLVLCSNVSSNPALAFSYLRIKRLSIIAVVIPVAYDDVRAGYSFIGS